MFPRPFIPYQPKGQKLPMTLWLWAYWPVMKVARAGQQSGNESTASAKVVPCRPSRRLTFGMCVTSAVAWSSVITTRMFGRPSLAAVAGRACAAAGRTSAQTAAIRASQPDLPSHSPHTATPLKDTGPARAYRACHTVSTSV